MNPTPSRSDAAVEAQVASLPGLADCRLALLSWVTAPGMTTEERDEIRTLLDVATDASSTASNALAELRDRFYREIEFGTGGLRGVTGSGNNRMNAPVIRRATQGLANYILKQGGSAAHRGVAIAYDSRLRSREFALEAACVLAANGIRSFVFDTVQTTPCLSWTVRTLGCISGLCLTASHNPQEYHGYKVYWEDGAQIIPPQDAGILQEVFRLTTWEAAQVLPEADARARGLLCRVPETVIDAYYEALDGLRIHDASTASRDVRIVYTPLHGTGAIPARRALTRWGFHDLHIVPEQELPDGRFPTVRKPNPEEFEALSLAIALAGRINADCALATDPDSDRLALVVKDPAAARGPFQAQSQGDYVFLNGNQTGALLIDHILSGLQERGRLRPEDVIVKTIVTSELHRLICASHGVRLFETLTGFKWIAGLVRSWEEAGETGNRFLFGTEESFGYMPGTYVRDKDGIGALCQAVEMVAALRTRGSTAPARLLELFSLHGAWQEDLLNFDLVGEEGALRIGRLMQAFRLSPPQAFAGSSVVCVRDYKLREVLLREGRSFIACKKESITLPVSDVLQFELEDGSRLSMRPSGTEPKLKVYVSVRTPVTPVTSASPASAVSGAESAYAETCRRVRALRMEVAALMEAIP
jgi:phosphoglucomutase